MGHILVVDDTPFWRDVVSDALNLHHYSVITAGNGVEALGALKAHGADLILLDVEMPEVHGLSFLDRLRREPKWKALPVIMLTGDMQKEHVLLAGKLGASGYMLKSRFSPQELIARVQQHLPAVAGPAPAVPDRLPLDPPAGAVSSAPPEIANTKSIDPAPRLMDRESCLERAAQAMKGTTLAGVVAEVIALANSPRVDLSDLASTLGRDAVLASNVLQAANSASKTSSRGVISTLQDAVRVVGCVSIRNIAASVGVFTAMPRAETDGFDPIRCWQHSLGVAMLCDKLAPAESKGLAYLVGLCHDLGEVLFRGHFGPEYRLVCAAHASTGLPLHQLEMQMLGATQHEICAEILKHLELPETICRPIDRFHDAATANMPLTDPLAKILRLADGYAIGCLLASSTHSVVRPFAKAESRQATGDENPPRPDDAQLRSDVSALTSVYARLSVREQRAAAQPLIRQSEKRVFIVRDPTFSLFDPLCAAIGAIAHVTLGDHLPHESELSGYQAVLGVARTADVAGMSAHELESSAKHSQSPRRTVLLTGKKDGALPNELVNVTHWPISLTHLCKLLID